MSAMACVINDVLDDLGYLTEFSEGSMYEAAITASSCLKYSTTQTSTGGTGIARAHSAFGQTRLPEMRPEI